MRYCQVPYPRASPNLSSRVLEAIRSLLEELVRMLTLDGRLILSDGAWRTIRVISPELPRTLACRFAFWTFISPTGFGNGYGHFGGYRKHPIKYE